MSYSANVRTLKKVQPSEIFSELAKMGEQIKVVSDVFPCLCFGTVKYALRGIEVNEEDDGYEVRINAMASMADYQLFPKVVLALKELTAGYVFGEDDDDEKPVQDPTKRFGLKWRRAQESASWNVTCAMVQGNHKPIIFNGLFAPFVVGPKILSAYNIDLNNPTGGEDYKRLGYQLFTAQWNIFQKKSADLKKAVVYPDEGEKTIRISTISLKNGVVEDFDFIPYADNICFRNWNTGAMVMRKFRYIDQILIPGKFAQIDEMQYARIADITPEDFKIMSEKASQFPEYDFPGDENYEEPESNVQNTFILFCNRMLFSDVNTKLKFTHIRNLDWSIYGRRNLKEGDKFYLVLQGDGYNGIVMNGTFSSVPSVYEDFGHFQNESYGVWLRPEVMIDPHGQQLLTVDELKSLIPDFDWKGGHSAVLSDSDSIEKLHSAWDKYVHGLKTDDKNVAMDIPTKPILISKKEDSNEDPFRKNNLDIPSISNVKSNDQTLDYYNQGVKFLVDEVFPRPSEMLHCIYDSEEIEKFINQEKQGADYHCINSSFRGTRLAYLGKDTLYQCIVKAYASHRPLILSPDMIWLVICQGLSKYVNDHSEECRDALVSHDGRMSLLVKTEQDLRNPDVNWESLLGKMLSEVANNTKGEFVSSVDMQFTTTSVNEHIAIQTTVMDIVKPYFEFIFVRMICGIPYIRLLGTPNDWQKIKTNSAILNRFGLDWWYNDLAPILEQFVNASNGIVNTKFWKSMVQKKQDRLFDEGGGCVPFGHSKINGWCLKLFPFTEYGRTPSVVEAGHGLLPEFVKVPFKFVQHFPNGDENVFNMELCSGFVGVEEDPIDHALCPKIGWMVSEKPSVEENIEWLNRRLDYCRKIRVKKVPEILREMKHIRTLNLTFIDDVVLPDWMDELEIEDFTIIGRMTKETKAMIKKRFPNVNFCD